MNDKLLAVFSRALDKINAGDFNLIPFNGYDGPTDGYLPEEEVLHWMLAKAMRDRKDDRYKLCLEYVKHPKGVHFNSTEFSLKEIGLFASPQTKATMDK